MARLVREVDGLGSDAVVSRPIGEGSQSGPIGVVADLGYAEWALVVKEGGGGGELSSSLDSDPSASCSSFGSLGEVSVNGDKGEVIVLLVLVGMELGCAGGND